jgi:pimeloyl-ACP methyl ester carboxylesterase
MTQTQPQQLSYLSIADGSAQPYWIYLPPQYSSKKKYPLAVLLHGYDPAITKENPWLPDEKIWSTFTNAEYVLAIPYGRRNSDFVDIGEDDVLRVREETMRQYSIDAQRVFLVGVSMGAYGAYADALHHPDKWRAAAAISGRTDFYQWFQLNRDALPDWKKVLFDANDPRHLARNALHLPFYIQQGALDQIDPPQQSRAFVDDLRKLNYGVRYDEYTNAGHYMYFDGYIYRQIVDWLNTIPPEASPHRKVRLTTGTLRDGKTDWVRITAFDRYDQLASIDAHIAENNSVEVTTSNVAGFELTPPKVLFTSQKDIEIKLNGTLLPQKYSAGQKIMYPQEPPPQSFPGYKTAHRSGPIKACFRDPFLAVYGTTNPDDQIHAWQFVSQWQGYADGVPPMKADKDVTPDDLEKYNLILFGTPDSNLLLAKIADKLPVKFSGAGYQIGQKYFSGKNTGVIFCYPSPFSTRRMIVVQAGLYWGEALPINHKWDLLPDYIIYTDSIDAGNSWRAEDKTNHALAAGFFDHYWK